VVVAAGVRRRRRVFFGVGEGSGGRNQVLLLRPTPQPCSLFCGSAVTMLSKARLHYRSDRDAAYRLHASSCIVSSQRASLAPLLSSNPRHSTPLLRLWPSTSRTTQKPHIRRRQRTTPASMQPILCLSFWSSECASHPPSVHYISLHFTARVSLDSSIHPFQIQSISLTNPFVYCITILPFFSWPSRFD